MRPKFLTLSRRDFFKGLVIAILTAIITFLTDALASGMSLDLQLLGKVGLAAAIAFLSYLLKNLFTNSQGEMLTPEPK